MTEPQYKILGISGFSASLGAWREAVIKPAADGLLAALLCVTLVLAGLALVRGSFEKSPVPSFLVFLPWFAGAFLGLLLFGLAFFPGLERYMLPGRFWLDAHHFGLSLLALALGGAAWTLHPARKEQGKGSPFLSFFLVLALASGALILLEIPGLRPLTRICYTLFDLSLALVLLGSLPVGLGLAASWTRRLGKA